MGRSLSAPSIITGGRAPTSNGFARRKIITNPGAFNFQLPNDVSEFDMAVFGAGGGGALRTWLTGTQVDATPGGGGGGGFARRRFYNANGGLISGVVGTPGAGGKQDVPASNPSPAMVAGSNGGTTTATLNSITLTATGGAGGVTPQSGRPGIRAAGGVGTGGDLNSNGGQGGAHYNENLTSQFSISNPLQLAPGGGGSSGHHRGNGGNGGNAIFTPGTVMPGSGGGWGGDGCDGFIYGYEPYSVGAGSFGPGVAFDFVPGQYGRFSSLFLGMGGSRFEPISKQVESYGGHRYDWEAPLIEDWWDIADIRGWAGGWLRTSNQNRYGWPGGPGSGGGSDSSGANMTTPGFGGGACGTVANTDGARPVSAKAAGGIGGGGAGRVLGLNYDASAQTALWGKSVYGGYGGPGCVIIWY